MTTTTYTAMRSALATFIEYNDNGGPPSFDVDAMWANARAALAGAEGMQAEVDTLRQQLAEAQALIEVQMSNVKIPEPIGTICFDGGRWEQNWVSSQDAYSEEQLKQYGDDRAREALEMAAREIGSAGQSGSYLSKRVRELAKEIK